MSQTHDEPGGDSPPNMPGWVKVLGIIALILVLLIGIHIITGMGGPHGPSRHLPSGDSGGQTQPIEHSLPQARQ